MSIIGNATHHSREPCGNSAAIAPRYTIRAQRCWVWPITEVFVNEWFGALILIRVALESSVEGDDNSFPSIVYALRLVYGFLPQIHRRPFKRS
jgi:hypothetical protein